MSGFVKSAAFLIPSIRIGFALSLITACLVFGGEIFGFVPKEYKYLLLARKQISESLAVQFATVASNVETSQTNRILKNVVERNSEIITAGIRTVNGNLVYKVGDHENAWQGYNENDSSLSYLVVPIYKQNRLWGNIELRFVDIENDSLSSIADNPLYRFILYLIVVGFFVYSIFILKTLKVLDPSSIVPDRVNAAFDTLAEALVIVDEKENIVLANKAFSDKLSKPFSSLIGKEISKLNWKFTQAKDTETEFPWQKALRLGESNRGLNLAISGADGNNIIFSINASVILSGSNAVQGVLVTLDDVTEIEKTNTALKKMIIQLEDSHSEIHQKNIELNYLATRDPLTGCLNRRAFNEQFDVAFNHALTTGDELSCIMTDIDRFKLVNDNYGHSVGDEVIKLLAEVLHLNTRKDDIVGRYGGEEFCVVLPGISGSEAVSVAERIRLRIKDESIKRFESGPHVTASLGVATIKDLPESPSELNKFADEALYAAKESGRNRVIRWQLDANFIQDQTADTQKVKQKSEIIPANISENIEELQTRIAHLESMVSKFSSEIEYYKNYDEVTGLPNKILFYDRVSQFIERSLRSKLFAAIILVEFKPLVDAEHLLENQIEKKLAKEVVSRLSAIFRKSDSLTHSVISRYEKSEFSILATDLPAKENVVWLVDRLIECFREPIDMDTESICLTCRVGISLYPNDGRNVDDLLANAFLAKNHIENIDNKSRYQFFDASMHEMSVNNIVLYKELLDAINLNQFVLFYQAKLDVLSNRIIGVEALIRWNHPNKGLLSPYYFIDFAERRGLILDIGNWVIRETCSQLKQWMSEGLADFRVAVNISGAQLSQPDLTDNILSLLSEYDVPPRMFEIELTETTLMKNFQNSIETLSRFKNRGINVSIDDFGTGYSSLSYLKNLPITTVKIDGSFIKDICADDSDKRIVKAIIEMAHSLSFDVVAEGVEDKDQFELLESYSCDQIQGYWLSKPIPAAEIIPFIKNGVTAQNC